MLGGWAPISGFLRVPLASISALTVSSWRSNRSIRSWRSLRRSCLGQSRRLRCHNPGRALRGCLRSMASRPVLHPFLERLVSWLIPPRSLRRIDGVGELDSFRWDGLGFFWFCSPPMRRVSRGAPSRYGPRFTRSRGATMPLTFDFTPEPMPCSAKAIMRVRHLGAWGCQKRNLIWCGLPPMCRMDGNRNGFGAVTIPAEDAPSVLFLGRRDEGKGYPAFLKSWPLVLQSARKRSCFWPGPADRNYENLKAALPAASLRDLGCRMN